MTEVLITPDTIQTRRQWFHELPTRTKARIFFVSGTLAIAPAATSALIGTGMALKGEHGANAGEARKAQGLERCIAFEKSLQAGRVVLSASDIPRSTQADCGVKKAIDAIDSALKDGVDGVQGLPEGTKITAATNPLVSLPGVAVLRTEAHAAQAASEGTGLTYPIAGGVVGGFAGLGLVVGAFAARDWVQERDRLDHSTGTEESR